MRPTRSLALLTAALLTLGVACSHSSDDDAAPGATTTRPSAGTTVPGTTPGTAAGEPSPAAPDAAAGSADPGRGGGAAGAPGQPAGGPAAASGGAASGGPSAGGGGTGAPYTTPEQPLAPPPGPGGLPADTSAIQAILRDSYGMPFTAEQGACLGTGFAAQPEALRTFQNGYAPPLPLAQMAVGVLVRCYGSVPPAVDAFLQSTVSQRGLNPAQAGCWAPVLRVLGVDDLAGLLALQKPALDAHGAELDRCNRTNA
jgi:hypothetical protein